LKYTIHTIVYIGPIIYIGLYIYKDDKTTKTTTLLRIKSRSSTSSSVSIIKSIYSYINQWKYHKK